MSEKISEIQTLRAISILAVVGYHYFPLAVSFGYLGVDVFLVISGFIVAMLISKGNLTPLEFIERRLGRLMGSALIVLLPFSIFAFFVLGGDELKDALQSMVAFFLAGSNILFQMEADYFTDFAIRKPLLHTWSLSIEVQFYFFVAALLLIVNKHIALFVATASFISFLLFALFHFYPVEISIPYSAGNASALFFNPVFRFWQFGIGFITWSILQNNSSKRNLGFTVFVLLAICSALFYVVAAPEEEARKGGLAVLAVAFSVFFLSTARFLVPVHPLATSLGNSSYLLYLIHFPILFVLEWYGFLNWYYMCLGIIISVLMAEILTRSWEPKLIGFFRNNRIALIIFPLIAVLFLAIYFVTDASRYNHPQFVQIEQEINQRRLNLIDSVIVGRRCQYYDGSDVELSVFLKEWSCFSDSNSTFVAGDSTAADMKMAFVENEIATSHIGGAGCSIDPKYMSSNCKKLFSTAVKRIEMREREKRVNIILRQRFSGTQITEEALRRIVTFWKVKGAGLVVMPFPIEVPRMKGVFRMLAQKGLSKECANFYVRDSQHQQSLKILQRPRLQKKYDYEVFNPDRFIFKENKVCLVEGGSFNLKDQVHWSPGKTSAKAEMIRDFCRRFECK